MKHPFAIAAILSFAALTSLSCGPGAESPGAVAGLTPSAFKSATFANGATVIVHPGSTESGPMVAVGVRLDAGPLKEKSGEAGFSSLLGRILSRTGEGTVSARMAGYGSTLSIDVQPDGIYLGALVLAEDAGSAAAALATLVNEAPDAATLEKARTQLIADLQEARAAGAMAVRDAINGALYPELSFGADTARRIASLTAMTPVGFAAWRARVTRPDTLNFALVGALDQEIIESLCRVVAAVPAAAAEEKKAEEEPAADPEQKHVPIRLLDRPDFGGAALYLMRRLPGIPAEDYYPLQAVNHVLNGQSTFARLTALQVAGRLPSPITSSLDLHGSESSHVITAQVPVSGAGDLFARIMQQIEQMYSGTLLNSRLLEQEVADARNLLRGQLLRQTETPAQLARFVLWARAMGFTQLLPSEHLALVAAVDKAKMLAAVEKYLVPGLNSLLAIGPAGTLRAQFSAYGEVQTISAQ